MESCLPNPEILTGYQSLLDATIFHVVWRQIDPEPPHHPIPLNDIEESMLRTARAKNFDCVIKNLKQLYEEELRQTLLIIPDCSILGHSPGKEYKKRRNILIKRSIFIISLYIIIIIIHLKNLVLVWKN